LASEGKPPAVDVAASKKRDIALMPKKIVGRGEAKAHGSEHGIFRINNLNALTQPRRESQSVKNH
jgi:hypothetical protein